MYLNFRPAYILTTAQFKKLVIVLTKQRNEIAAALMEALVEEGLNQHHRITMSNLSNFQFNDQSVRVIVKEGNPWFVLVDICLILEIDTVDAQKRLKPYEIDNTEIETNSIRSTSRSTQTGKVISESGLYRLVLGSRKPIAKPFQDWICQEVLPSIRKTGSYSVLEPPKSQTELLLIAVQQLVEVEKEQKRQAENQARLAAEQELLKQQVALEAQKTEHLEEMVEQLDAEVGRIFKPDGDYYTIRGYAILKGIKNLSLTEAKELGKQASSLSRSKGVSIDKMQDPRYGMVGCYSQYILEEVFAR